MTRYAAALLIIVAPLALAPAQIRGLLWLVFTALICVALYPEYRRQRLALHLPRLLKRARAKRDRERLSLALYEDVLTLYKQHGRVKS